MILKQMKRINLRNLETLSFDAWKATLSHGEQRLCIATCGYESRARHWPASVFGNMPSLPETDWLVFAFRDFVDKLARPDNDAFYKARGLSTKPCHSRESDPFLAEVEAALTQSLLKAGERSLEVSVDYSCMPRLWYCSLPKLFERFLRPIDRATFWYSQGDYTAIELPTAGIGDFTVFAGKPSLGAGFRTHFFGLGLDRVRSQSVWRVIDPQNLLCFYAEPLGAHDYRERLKEAHHDLLSQTNYECSLPVDDFTFAFSKLTSMAREFRKVGDVIIVPDGPKPFILASSLVPMFLEESGIVCFHVARRKHEDFTPVDVKPVGRICGFSFVGCMANK